jgi:hypothetical protein
MFIDLNEALVQFLQILQGQKNFGFPSLHILIYFPRGSTDPSRPRPPRFEIPPSHSDTQHLVELLRTSDRPAEYTSN